MIALLLAVALFSSLSAEDLLNRSIAYHDPGGRWERGAFENTDVSSPLEGTGRRTVLRLDNVRGRFEMEQAVEGRVVKIVVENGNLEVRLDRRADISAKEIERFRLAPAQVLRTRNFYLYLYGLPMKLKDPGTRLNPEAKETVFQGRDAYELRVTYDEGVGSDTWYFYLDRETCALVGHRFYHDESAGDGEYAVLSEEVSGEGLRLPRVRKWFRNRGDEFFVTHTILSIAAP